MKKNKTRTESAFQKLIDKYKVLYFLSFSLGYALLSVVIGVTLFFSITRIYLTNSEKTVMEYADRFGAIDNKPNNIPNMPGSFSGEIIYPRISDPNMLSVVYYVDETGKEVERFVIGSTNDELNEEIEEDYLNEKSDKETTLTTLDGFYYISYLREITNESLMKPNQTGYVVIYYNVNAQFEFRDSALSIYVAITLIAFLCSFLIGVVVMRGGTKPLEIFVRKQANFVSDASHELRTPLAVVQSKIENVLSQPDKTVTEVSEDLAISLNEISRLTKLTQELLTLARNDRESMNLNYSVFDLDDLIKEITEPFIEIAQINEKKLTYTGSSCMIKLDKDRIKQILIINIDNALKYTEAGDEINLTLKQSKDAVQISIADTGVGLSDEAKKKVFDRFYRADKARSRESGGNGLGLSIAYSLVRLQKGVIAVYDNQPKGTKFVITFPKQSLKKDESKIQFLLKNKQEKTNNGSIENEKD